MQREYNFQKNRMYVCIDLKSFYASVECVDLKMDPLTARLVVADSERSEKTICLAITPAMKALGIHNRCRLFEIPANIEYVVAKPRMQRYIDVSANIYSIYLKYVSKEDIHVYSIDEVFIDVTDYLDLYHMTARELGIAIIDDIMEQTGITATVGIGTNLYLAKIAMDIRAKHVDDHIGELDEDLFKKYMWKHRPLTDFWRIGPGTAKHLERLGMFTMQDIAEADEVLLFREFGIDAELMIDHAYGRESTTMEDIKKYKPRSNSISSGQVLAHDTSIEDGALIVKEMAELLSLDLVDKHLVTQNISIHIRYSNRFGVPGSNGSAKLPTQTSSSRLLIDYVERLYLETVKREYPVKGFNLSFNNVIDEDCIQYDLFTDPEETEKERRLQRAMIDMKKKFGKNAVLKGMNLEAAGTTRERNRQIGGHRSGD